MANQKFGTATPSWVTPISAVSATGTAPAGGEDADRNGDRGRQHDGHQRQRQADDRPLGNQLRHRHAVGVAGPEPALQQAREPGQVPLQRRSIEAELGPERRQRVLPRTGAEDHCCRIAGQQLEHDEDDHGGAEQRHQRRQEAAEEEDGQEAPFVDRQETSGMAQWRR